MMAGRTPNLDKLAAEGMLLHRLLRRGELHGRPRQLHHRRAADPHRPDHGRPGRRADRHAGRGADDRHRAQVMGYATGQFGKNHLGDLNEFLPTVHGFDEFFGYLYHLDAMEDPAHPNYPQDLLDKVGPRNMVHSWATDVDDPTVEPRWGKVGKQKIEDAGTLYPEADGDGRRRDPRPLASSSSTRPRPTASRSSSGSTRRACTSSRTSRTSTRSMRNSENGWSDPGSRHGPARRHRRRRS